MFLVCVGVLEAKTDLNKILPMDLATLTNSKPLQK